MGFFKRFTRPRAKLWLKTEKDELTIGEELKGTAEVQSEEEFDIEGILVRLQCWESIKRISGHYENHYETDADTGEDTISGRDWVEDESWDEEVLHSQDFVACSQMHISIGFKNGFPFVFKIPSTERETYHGADRKVEWLINAIMPIKGRKHIETQTYEILVAKPSALLKEVIREVVLIPCAYCKSLMPQTALFCPNCGARRKG